MSPKRNDRPIDIYVRVSDVRGREGDSFQSPDQQEQRCRTQLAADGLEVGEVFSDFDVSGGETSRPAFDQMLARARSGESGGVIVHDLTRFGRYSTMAQDIIDLEEHGAVFISCAEKVDTSTSSGRFFLRVMEALAVMYREQIGERFNVAQRNAVDRGVHITRHVPPGYERNGDGRLKPHPRHGKTISQAFRLAADGETPSRIAKYLTERGLPSGDTEHAVWKASRIKRLLANRAYLGEARYGKEIKNPNAHEPLTDEATWLLAQRRPTRASIKTESGYLLTSLARCASCRHAMRPSKASGKTIATYRCATETASGRCAHPCSCSMGKLDSYVLETFLARAAKVDLEQLSSPDDEADGLATLAHEAEQSYREALTDVELRSLIGAEDHSQMVAGLYTAWQEALLAVPVRTSQEPLPHADLAQLVSELQDRGDVASLRELLAAEIQAVFVRPAASRAKNLPIEDRVRIVWRDEEELELPRRGTVFEPRPYVWG